MLRYIPLKLIFILLFAIPVGTAYSQCTAQEKGKNIIQNPGFELGDTLFSSPLVSWNKCENNSCNRGWSLPGEYFVDNRASFFNSPFTGSPHTGSKMLMVDADCVPGGSVWEQTVYVYPNTNYYFSLWIASLKEDDPAKLSFEVNGVTLGKNVKAPTVTGKWIFYEDVWNSGDLSGEVQLRIKEQSGVNCENGDDFMLDDISFIPGCEFGAPGPIADLGEDVTICGSGGSITLNSGVASQPNVTFLWNTGEKTPTITITEPGTYYVCVDSVSACPRSDVIEVLDDYTIGLSSDVDLCNPATVTLDPGYSGEGVTYKWFKNGNRMPGRLDQELLVNSPGNYVVEVHEPICGIRTDTINVTSSAALAGNADFCPPAEPSLSITGPGNYAWYDSEDLSNRVAVGNTYDPGPITETTTYYVKDTTSFVERVGQPSMLSTGFGSGGQYDQGFEVEVLNDLILDSVSVYPASWNAGTMNVGIKIYDVTSGSQVVVEQLTRTISVNNNGGNPTEADKVQVKVGVALEGGKKYVITNEGSSGQLFFHQGGANAAFPYSLPGFMKINKLVNQYQTNLYGVFYDWVVVVGSPCKPVPVIATSYCPPTCTMPAFVQLSGARDICGGSVMLKTLVTPAEIYEFEFYRDNTPVQSGSSDSLEVSLSGDYKVIVTDPKDPGICFLESDPVTINSITVGDAQVPSGNTVVCEASEVVFDIPNVSNADYYSWNLPDDAVIVGSESDTSITVLFGKNPGYVKVTPVNIACGDGGADSLQVAVNLLPDSAKGLNGLALGCKGDTLSYSLPPVAEADSYVWSIPGDAGIIVDNGTTIDVKAGSTEGFVIVTPVNSCGEGASDSLMITFSEKPVSSGVFYGETVTCAWAEASFSIDSIDHAFGYQWEIIGQDAEILGTSDSIGLDIKVGADPVMVIVTPLNNVCGNGEPDTLHINASGPYNPQVNAIPDVTSINLGDYAMLNADVEGDGPFQYVWYDENDEAVGVDQNLYVSPLLVDGGSVKYFIQVKDVHGCLADDSAQVNVVRVPLYIPNLITPNKDNRNDAFAIRGITPGTKVEIHNRWGEMIYKSDNYKNDWDAKNVSDGVYFVMVELGITNEVYKGWLEVFGKKE